MQKKLLIGGEEADNSYNLRTTKFILSEFFMEANKRGVSANVLINKTLLPIASRYKARRIGIKSPSNNKAK